MPYRNFTLMSILMFASMPLFAQKQSFDVVSYIIPTGWVKTTTENAVQLSIKDESKGIYAAAVVVRSVTSNASAADNFNNSWEALVKGTVTTVGVPTMLAPQMDKEWNIISGQASYTEEANKGVATLLTATGNNKMASVVLLTNTQKYQHQLLDFLNSLELVETTSILNKIEATSGKTINSRISGKIWQSQSLEKHDAAYGNMSGFHTGGFWIYQLQIQCRWNLPFYLHCRIRGGNQPCKCIAI